MASNINRVVISGRLTRDPELRATAGGSAVMSMGVAVNDRRKNQQTGQWEDCPNFIDCTVFGNRADSLSRILTKGTLVCIEGKLRWSSWERDGQKRSKVEVVVDEIEVAQRAEAPAPATVPDAPPADPYGPYAAAGDAYGDEIPF